LETKKRNNLLLAACFAVEFILTSTGALQQHGNVFLIFLQSFCPGVNPFFFFGGAFFLAFLLFLPALPLRFI